MSEMVVERKELNWTTARTLSNTLGISRKVSSAITSYRRRKGNFKHIDELWKVPGMTRKIHEHICHHYFVPNQRPPMMGEPEPYVCTSLQQTVDTDSLMSGNRHNRTVVPNLKAKGTQHNGQDPTEFDTSAQKISVVPISVRESPSGRKLCIVYKREPHSSCGLPQMVTSETAANSLQLWPMIQSPVIQQRLKGILRSPTPSPEKQKNNSQRKCKSKVRLSPKKVGTNANQPPTKTFITTRNKTPSPSQKKSPDGATVNKDIQVQYDYSEHIEHVCEPSTSAPFGQSAESSEKVRQWISSNVDFMKSPRPVGSFLQTIASTPFDTLPPISGQAIHTRATQEGQTKQQPNSPKSKVSFVSDGPGTYTIHQTFRGQIPNPQSATPLSVQQQQFTATAMDIEKSNDQADKNGLQEALVTTRETMFRRKPRRRPNQFKVRSKSSCRSQDSQAEPATLQCVVI